LESQLEIKLLLHLILFHRCKYDSGTFHDQKVFFHKASKRI
jgi:hypothetical protein